MNDYAFGNFLYTLRQEKGISQLELGKKLGVTNKAVSKWETGAAKPNTKLLPQIADILGVTVEELFAAKRIKKDTELESVKSYLIYQKRRFAIRSSVFLSLLIILPMLLIEFIIVVMGFKLPDDILGPLGSVSFIFLFIISLVSYIIYRSNFRRSLLPKEKLYRDSEALAMKWGLLICTVSFWSMAVLLTPLSLLIADHAKSFKTFSIIILIYFFILIILLGVIVCLASIKHLLKIKFSSTIKNKLNYKELPVWGKVCHIAIIVLAPVLISIQIIGLYEEVISLQILLFLAYFSCIFALIIYNIKRNH